MTITPQSIITLARSIYNDAGSAFFRISNDDLVGYVNDGLQEASILAPSLFHTTGDFTCAAGQTEQAVTFADARQLSKVIRIKDGRALHPVDLDALSRFNPDWASDTAAAAQNWCRHDSDPLRFYVYPKAPVEMQVLEVLFVRIPGTYALNDPITEVPASVAPALSDYVIYRAESRDDEHSNSGRAVSHYQAFVQKIGGGQGA